MTAQLDGRKWETAAAVLALVALCFLAFGGALRCGFVHYDDDQYVVDNPQVLAGLTWSGARWAFTTGHASNWHPLTWLSLMADTEWCGGEARGYHATNLLLHAMNGVLLFLVMKRWTGRFALALAATAFWATHPLRTESVVWISERKDVLAAFFGLLALEAYGGNAAGTGGVNAPGSRKPGIAIVALFFALSLMSKPTWVTLPFVLLLVDVWPLGRWPKTSAWKLVREKGPLFLLAVASSAVTYLVQQAGGAVQSVAGLPMGLRLENAVVATAWYLFRWVWPFRLAVNYPYPVAGHSAGAFAGSLAVLAVLSLGAAWSWRRGRKAWGVGWLWFLGTLVPMIGLVQVGVQAWADRYSYLPHVGLTLALAWGAGETMAGASRRKGLAVVLLGLALTSALLARRQTAIWRNSESLFRHILAHTENNARAHGILGYVYALEGRNGEAVEQLSRALAIQPDNLRALNNLAWVWGMAPDASPDQMAAGLRLARQAAAQIRKAKAKGTILEPGVETAVVDTLTKVEERIGTLERAADPEGKRTPPFHP